MKPSDNPVRDLRMALQMTQVGFAEKVDIPYKTITAIEQGCIPLSERNRQRLIGVFNLKDDWAREIRPDGRHVAQLHESLGVTKSEFARKAKIRTDHLTLIEAGEMGLCRITREKIEQAYHLKDQWWLSNSGG